MKSVVEWLVHMEEKAERIYERSADIFIIDDKEFSEFLRQLGSEERHHKQVVLDVSEFIKKMEQVPDSKIAVDDETMQRIELPFIDIGLHPSHWTNYVRVTDRITLTPYWEKGACHETKEIQQRVQTPSSRRTVKRHQFLSPALPQT